MHLFTTLNTHKFQGKFSKKVAKARMWIKTTKLFRPYLHRLLQRDQATSAQLYEATSIERFAQSQYTYLIFIYA